MTRKFRFILLPALTLTVLGASAQISNELDRESYESVSFSDFNDLARMKAYVVGNGGENLGKINREMSSDSLSSEYGKGSPYSANGLFNEHSKYGSKYGDTSAYNEYATKPPMILLKKGEKIVTAGVVTKNKYARTKGKRVDPDALKGWLRSR